MGVSQKLGQIRLDAAPDAGMSGQSALKPDEWPPFVTAPRHILSKRYFVATRHTVIN